MVLSLSKFKQDHKAVRLTLVLCIAFLLIQDAAHSLLRYGVGILERPDDERDSLTAHFIGGKILRGRSLKGSQQALVRL